MSSSLRLLAVAVGSSLVLVAGVFGWEWWHFGLTTNATFEKLEREVRVTVDERAREVENLAVRVAAEQQLTLEASTNTQALATLFERLRVLASPSDDHRVAVTVYVPDPGPSGFRPLAWSEGPGDRLVSARLRGPQSSFVAPGHAGLRLIRVEPVEIDGKRIAVAAAETILAPADRRLSDDERRLVTNYGPVRFIERYASARDEVAIGQARAFTISTRAGEPLFEAQVDEAELAARRSDVRHRGLALAFVPLPIALALMAAPLVNRRRSATRAVSHLGWTIAAVAVIGLAVSGLVVLARWAALPDAARPALVALAWLGGVALTIGHLWWRPIRRAEPGRAPVRFVCENLAAGAVLLVAIEAAHRLVSSWITPEVLGQGQSVLFPFSFDRLLSFVAVLIGEVAIGWAAVSALASAAVRWRFVRLRFAVAVVPVLWLGPLVFRLWLDSFPAFVAPALLGAGLIAVACGLVARRLRRLYRHTTVSLRLVLGFAAIVAPLIVLYPVAAALTDDATRRLVADEYAPAVARLPQDIRGKLAQAQADVDAWPALADMVAMSPSTDGTDTQAAFLVWRSTNLSRSRAISEVELFGPDNALVSRFAFNLPDYLYGTRLQIREGAGCKAGAQSSGWDVFGEAMTFGSEKPLMLHAERSICDASGRLLGGIVLHVASDNYDSLPFVSSPNPYTEVVGEPITAATVRLPDLRIAVYGWSQRPIFTSGRVTWPLPQDVFAELYRTGQPVWRPLSVGDQTYAVHFSQNRPGVYAIGYPLPTNIDHAARLAEIVALTAGLFVALQIGALAYAAANRGRPAPLRLLLHEVRTSFYRKLFLSFVAVAVVPVVVAAGAFGVYMTARFQADVEREAETTVAVARRVFQELEAASGQPIATGAPTDDALVWIRQVTGEDVNYFEGAELRATSRRDLFDSGVLPTRTPAAVFRGIVLEQRPTLVADDRVGELSYVVAATRVPSRGPEAILTVPLAPRQRELASELDTLNRRVMVGAVLVVLLAAGLGTSLAGRVADPVSRLTRATRQIAAGRLDVKIASESADELRTLVDDFNSMAATLVAQRAELARTNQLKAWNEMARQVAHEIKNPLTPVQLAAEHLQHVHDDRQRPLGAIVDQCVQTILTQVRLLRRIASEFANFSSEPVSRPVAIAPLELVESVIQPYRVGVASRVAFDVAVPADLPLIWADRTLVARAFTNLAENALQAMPSGGSLRVTASPTGEGALMIRFADSGAGMDEATVARAFEPFFSTKAGGSGLGLANAKRAIEREGGSIAIASSPGVGTTITVTLPLAGAPRDAEDAPPPSR